MSIVIRFEYTETYPITPPFISIDECVPSLEDEDRVDLARTLIECAEENLKIPMIYTLANRTLEWFREDRTSRSRPTRESSIIKIPTELQTNIDNTEYQSTRVTREAFLIWKKGFDETRTRVVPMRNLEEKKATRLTGRQLFELDATLATSDTTYLLEEEEEEDPEISLATEELLREMRFSEGSEEKTPE